MQNKENHFQGVGICHRIFNFILNSLVGVGLKRVTLGHPMPRGSTEGQAELIGDERENSKPKDVSDSVVRINFKQTEEEPDYWNWTHVDEPEKVDDGAMERRNEFIEDDKPEVHGKTGKRIVIPITDSSKSAKPVLTGLGLNINEISETFIQNTKERLSRNVSLMEPEES
ncbi:hypothetical protein HRI_001053700 [Hibiscus trionum]|uniref:Uncharacterized protein n=1 Tax=Hibiscus trionum TaxID=183268 RepID=A0A9W7HAA9_HIBTR|nr:hypothetical protein HRI_001053700 [Hibiscus trionum]